MKKFRFHFNTQYAADLRDAVNDRRKQSIENTHEDKQIKNSYLAWDRTCAAMDRLEDTLAYLNQIELGYSYNIRSAFDFYDFLNNAFVVIDCIKTLGRIFSLENQFIENIEKSKSVFGNTLNAKCTDESYFEYIRSLCSVHPLCTNRQSEYLNGSKFHCCPFVIWSDNPFGIKKGDSDLLALIYSSKRDKQPEYIGLYISQFEAYLKKWIDLIPKIIEAKNYYTDEEYEKLKKTPVKDLRDFDDNIIDWLRYLKDEYYKRFDYGNEYIFDEYIHIFSITLSDPRNNIALEKYQNAIKYALKFLRNELQNMSYKGFENNGIKYPESCSETTLFDSISSISLDDGAFSKYGYSLQKLYYLEESYHYNEYEKLYARRLLEEPKKLINRYVQFTNAEPDEERFVLVQLAIYLEALTRKCLINKNIPNTLEYRINVLADEEFTELLLDDPINKNQLGEMEDLKNLLKEYRG